MQLTRWRIHGPGQGGVMRNATALWLDWYTWGMWMRYLIVVGMWAVLVGCQKPQTVEHPFPVDRREYDRLYESSIDTLRDQGFELDRQDYRFGTITTKPRIAPTWFEPWDSGNSTPGQTSNATFDHQRRIVVVRLLPDPDQVDDDPNAYLLDVQVQMQRRNHVTRRLNGNATGNVFADVDRVPVELARRGIAEDYWEPIGEDSLLATRLVREIVTRSFDAQP